MGLEEDRLMTPLRLLVVEDDLASLELMVEVFRSLKAEVHPVSDSEKVVGRTQQNNSCLSHQSRRKRTGTGHCFPVAHAAPGSTPTPLSVGPIAIGTSIVHQRHLFSLQYKCHL